MSSRRTLQRLVTPLLGLCLAAPLPADDLERARDLRAAGDILALEDILGRLPVQPDARIVDVEIEEEDGQVIYEIERLEAAGQVREYKFDARTGQLLKTEDE